MMKPNKKLLLIISLSLLSVSNLNSQIGNPAADAAIVVNTANTTSQLVNLNKTIETLKAAQEKIKETMETVKWLQDIQDAIKLIELIDATICNMESYAFYLDFSIHYNCMVQFNHQLINTKFQFATNTINLISTASILMESSGRINSLKDAINALEEAQIKAHEFNSQIRASVRAITLTQYLKQQYKGAYMVSRY